MTWPGTIATPPTPPPEPAAPKRQACRPWLAVKNAFDALGQGAHTEEQIFARAQAYRPQLTRAELRRVLDRRDGETGERSRYKKHDDGRWSRPPAWVTVFGAHSPPAGAAPTRQRTLEDAPARAPAAAAPAVDVLVEYARARHARAAFAVHVRAWDNLATRTTITRDGHLEEESFALPGLVLWSVTA